MKCLPSLVSVLLALPLPLSLVAQSTDALPNPAVRLEQLDGTYSSNLRKYHAPVILDYLRDLEKLQQTLLTQGHENDAAQVLAEIEKTKKLSVATGLLSYDPLKPPPEPEAASPDKPPGGKGARRFSPDAITLSTSNAINPSPAAETLKQRPDAKALPIGHAEWRVEKIPAGVYEVMLVSSVIEGSEKMSVQATLGTLTAERKVPPPSAGGGPADFRVFRVGTFTLDQDMTNTVLTLESSTPTQPCMWVRNVILTHPKPPPGNGPPPGGGGGKPPPDGKPPGGPGGPKPGGPKPGGPKPDGPPPDGSPPK